MEKSLTKILKDTAVLQEEPPVRLLLIGRLLSVRLCFLWDVSRWMLRPHGANSANSANSASFPLKYRDGNNEQINSA